MAEYIERASFVGELTAAETQKELRNMTGADAYFAVLRMVNELHKADVAPVRHGKWIVTKEFTDVLDMDVEKYTCSACGEYRLTASGWSQATNYCPNCGAQMDADG